MKIDKIVFCSSQEYSPLWEVQSYIWKTKFNIEPVLILFGDKNYCRVSDKYGEVIQKKYSSDCIKSLQLTWSKFNYIMEQGEKTCITGDIDLLPLQTKYFVEDIKDIPDDCYSHLGYSIMAPSSNEELWVQKGGFCTGLGGCDLVAYYHCAKGNTYKNVYDFKSNSLVDQVKHILHLNKYGWGKAHGLSDEEVVKKIGHVPIPRDELPLWCSDENYSSDVLFQSVKSGKVKFVGRTYQIYWYATRIDRPHWNPNINMYDRFDFNKVKAGGYIDFHLVPPTAVNFEIQKKSVYPILHYAGMI